MAEEGGKKSGWVWIISSALFGAIVAIVGMTLADQNPPPAAIEIIPPEPTATAAPTATPGPLRVYITGAVNNPDVYSLPEGSIVADVVAAAGSFREDAAREMINLALPLQDGMQVHVPAIATQSAQPPPSGQQLATPAMLVAPQDSSPGLVNINIADLDTLDTLPGVGPAIAQSIIDFRQTNGPFGAIEEIMEVSGIGPAKFEQMKELITVE